RAPGEVKRLEPRLLGEQSDGRAEDTRDGDAAVSLDSLPETRGCCLGTRPSQSNYSSRALLRRIASDPLNALYSDRGRFCCARQSFEGHDYGVSEAEEDQEASLSDEEGGG